MAKNNQITKLEAFARATTRVPPTSTKTPTKPAQVPVVPTTSPAAESSLPPFPKQGGRIAIDKSYNFNSSFAQVLSAHPTLRKWRITEAEVARMDAMTLMELMIDVSPEVSKVVWDFLRMCNPGYSTIVYGIGTLEEDPIAKGIIDEFFDRLKVIYGSIDVVLNRMFLSGFLRGGLMCELVLSKDTRTMIDLATPDPVNFEFKKVKDAARGPVWQLGQIVNGKWQSLNFRTIQYIPIDPMPDSPIGRAPAFPSLFASTFLIGMMHDLRRVVAQQGYPRFDISIKLTELLQLVPMSDSSDPNKVGAFLNNAIAQVREIYGSLQPDDAFVHADWIEVLAPKGVVDSHSLGAIDGLIKALERMCVRALKSVPLMLAVDEATSEANANRQWEIYAAGVKSLQHYVENMLETLLEVGLNAAGVQGSVKFRFAELRAAEMLRDAQTEMLKIQNARSKWDHGYQSQDASAIEITGKKPDNPEPRNLPEPAKLGNLVAANPDPGSNREEDDSEILTFKRERKA